MNKSENSAQVGKNEKALYEEAAKRLFKKSKFSMRPDNSEKRVRFVHINGNAWAEEKRLIANGESFTVTRTNVTTKFHFLERKRADRIFSSVTFSYKEMNLFAEIRKEVRFNIEQKNLKLPDYTAKDIGYYLYSNAMHEAQKTGRVEFDDVMEFDIVKAYYTAAYNLGYISREFFLACIELPKTTRLRLIGSIATLKTIFVYKEGKLSGDPIQKYDPDLRKAWFHICKYVDECMRQLRRLLGEDFLFYWVDGLYCKSTDKIDDYLLWVRLKYNLDFEYKPVDRVVVEKDDAKKSMMVNVYKTGEDPAKPTRYYLNNDGEVIKELKEFYLKNFIDI